MIFTRNNEGVITFKLCPKSKTENTIEIKFVNNLDNLFKILRKKNGNPACAYDYVVEVDINKLPQVIELAAVTIADKLLDKIYNPCKIPRAFLLSKLAIEEHLDIKEFIVLNMSMLSSLIATDMLGEIASISNALDELDSHEKSSSESEDPYDFKIYSENNNPLGITVINTKEDYQVTITNEVVKVTPISKLSAESILGSLEVCPLFAAKAIYNNKDLVLSMTKDTGFNLNTKEVVEDFDYENNTTSYYIFNYETGEAEELKSGELNIRLAL